MKSGYKILHIICIALAAAVTQVFFLLCLEFLPESVAHWAYLLILIGGTILNAAILALDIVAYIKRKEFLYKACIIAYVMLVFASVVLYILLRTGFMEIAGDEELLKEYLERTGVWMSVLFVLLQFLQVVILPIPSTVTVVVGALRAPLRQSVELARDRARLPRRLPRGKICGDTGGRVAHRQGYLGEMAE